MSRTQWLLSCVCLGALLGCGGSGRHSLTRLDVDDQVAKGHWADPNQVDGEEITKLILTNNNDDSATFTAEVDDAVFVEPPSGPLGPGESICVRVHSRSACWDRATVIFQLRPVGASAGEGVDSAFIATNRNFPAKQAYRGTLGLVDGIQGLRPFERREVPCDVTAHSDGAQERIPDPETDIVYSATSKEDLPIDPLPDRVRFLRVDGASGGVITTGVPVASHPGAPFTPGGHAVLFLGMDGDIPLSHPTSHFQFAVVFDADGDTTNNYVASPAFPGDYFQGTDLWYEVNYTPAGGWTLDVTDARNNVFTPVMSAAAAVVLPRGVLFFVPLGELAVSEPGYRMTAFRHEGDFGLLPPFTWSANTAPRMDEPLRVLGGP